MFWNCSKPFVARSWKDYSLGNTFFAYSFGYVLAILSLQNRRRRGPNPCLLQLRPNQEPALLRRFPQRVRQSPQSGYHRKRRSDLGLRLRQNKEFTLLRRFAQRLNFLASSHPDTLNRLKHFAFGLDRRGNNNLRLLELFQSPGSHIPHAGDDRSDQIL